MESKETDSTPLHMFCVYCKKNVSKDLQPFQSNYNNVTAKEESTKSSGQRSSTFACLFCTEESKTCCILNRICESCKTFWHKKRFDEFMLNKIGSCEVCANTFYKGLKRVKHDCIRVGVFICYYCNRCYSDKLDLEKHMERRYEKYTCRICCVSYCHRKKFDLHCNSHNFGTSSTVTGVDDNLQTCESPTKDTLETHKVVHDMNVGLHTCMLCNVTFESDILLKEHYLILKIADGIYYRYCDKGFASEDHLVLHVGIHRNSRDYICKYCNKEFMLASTLKSHERRHEDSGRYKCKYCGKAFNMTCNLKKHESSHENLRQYLCKFCNKGFNQKNHLKDHERIHENLRQYTCKYCAKGFNRVSYMRVHETRHENLRQYKCEHCEKGYNTKDSLKSHEKRIHKKF